jgi:hypothetical protein
MRSIAQDSWKCVRQDEVSLETLRANAVGTTMHVSSASVFILVSRSESQTFRTLRARLVVFEM